MQKKVIYVTNISKQNLERLLNLGFVVIFTDKKPEKYIRLIKRS